MDKDTALHERSEKIRRHRRDIDKHMRLMESELANVRAILDAVTHNCRVLKERQQWIAARR